MSKPQHKRSLTDQQAKAVGVNIRVSPRKLNLVAQSIRGQSAERALATLTFSPKRVAQEVKKVLQSAIANAENNHDLDVDDLVVTEAWVGRNLVMKRFHARARGRGARIEKPFAQVTVVVEEKREEKAKEAPAAATATKKRRAPAKGAKRQDNKSKELA
jgi:large subunit ribosomal protein L22